jgi:hypothetical protein
MKNILLAIVLFFTACAAQISDDSQQNAAEQSDKVVVYLRNNSILPRKYTIIIYEPGSTYNSTNGFFLMPYAKKRFELKLGSKIYNANRKQVGIVMGGGSIRTDEPLVTVSEESGREGWSYDLRK